MDSSRVFQDVDELVFAMWDGFPVSPGHALIVPRRHVATWFEATAEEQRCLMNGVTAAKRVIDDKRRPAGYNIGINVGGAAGQTVSHLHVHVIPRYTGDVTDPRGGVRNVIPGKGNYLSGDFEPARIGDATPGWRRVFGTEQAPLLRALVEDLEQATSFDLAVAFLLRSGLELLEPHLYEFLDRNGSLRILTGDYLDVTEPEALLKLLDLELYVEELQQPHSGNKGRVELRVFQTGDHIGFHPKAYLVTQPGGKRIVYIGSSNLTRSALLRGIEWNHRLAGSAQDPALQGVTDEFDALFNHGRTVELNTEWIEEYRQRRQLSHRKSDPALVSTDDAPSPPPEPHAIQVEALDALRSTRRAGNAAGLVVLATGLGKTWLAAFDSSEFQSVLFVAHREEILRQAMATFRRIRPEARFGFYNGDEKDSDANVLFASIQTLGRVAHLGQFPPDAFDYIVIDEFHHASAPTYRRLIDHFEPAFLLGLTATPDRTDGGDLLTLCGENLVYRCDVVDGVIRELLCPFHYYGVPDSVDFRNIPWRSGRFDPEQLENAVVTAARAENALEQWRRHTGGRGLGFCVSQRHADYMAEHFRGNGVRSLAVHAGPMSAPRARTLERLEAGEIDIVFAVDMFNEGVDVPHVDTILMLRPTESRILWQQQFGRGLRRAEGKTHVRVIDYIGNHRTFLQAPMILLPGAADGPGALYMALRRLENNELNLPPGCEITYDLEALNILTALAQPRPGTEAAITWYRSSRDQHGIRPTATEVWHAGYDPKRLRPSFGSWFGFIRAEGDILEADRAAFEAHRTFLEALEVTPMVKSYKMLVLLGLLSRNAFPGKLPIDDLAEAVRHFASRNPLLTEDFGIDLNDDGELIKLLERNPINAWIQGQGMGGTSYFAYNENVFESRLNENPEHRRALAVMTRELCEYRLAQYIERLQGAHRVAPRIVCSVSHSNGRPILFLPDRGTNPGIPEGEQPVQVNRRGYIARFAKIAVNVVHQPDDDRNALPDILRKWFGEDVGQPGRSERVQFEWDGDRYVLRPIKAPGQGPELWTEYLRPDISRLWGFDFNPARWNQGYVNLDNHVFLLVSLDKTGLQASHQYDERFISPELFQWSSPNAASRSGAIGRKLKNHITDGTTVHLFIRERRKTPDGKGAPFVYCGDVSFVDWERDKPIAIQWRLRHPLPSFLHDRFGLSLSSDGAGR